MRYSEVLTRPHCVILRKIAGYERGRGLDEVPKRLQSHLVSLGFPLDCTTICDHEVDSLNTAEQWANGRLVVHHSIQRDPVCSG